MEFKAKQTKQGITRGEDPVLTISQPGDLLVDPISRLNAVDCHRQGCGTGASAKGSNKSTEITNTTYIHVGCISKNKDSSRHLPAHVKDECEGALARNSEVDERQNDEAMDGEANHHGDKVQAQLCQLLSEVFGGEDLASDQEADADRCKVDDPGCQLQEKVTSFN